MLFCPWDSPGKNIGVGCRALLQGIFLTQGSKPHLVSPALAGGFFTTSATREAQERGNVLVAQSCPTLCNPMDCSLPVSSVHGISQARVQEQVAILFSRGSSQPKDQTQVSYIAGRSFTIGATQTENLFNLLPYSWLQFRTGVIEWCSSEVKLLSRVLLCDPMKPTRLLRPWDFPGKSTRVGCHFLLQGIFLTQDSHLDLLQCRQLLYRLSSEGSPGGIN